MRGIRRAALVLAVSLTLGACAIAGAEELASARLDATITAQDMAFSEMQLALPANRTTAIRFRNRDGAPHNVAIYRSAAAEDAIFVGEIIGRVEVTYAIPPLRPGTYFFRCDLHPAMTGHIIVGGD